MKYSVCALVFSSGCALAVQGNGVIKTESRAVESFVELEVGGSFEVKVAVGEPASLVLKGDDNLLPLIESGVKDGLLFVKSTKQLNATKRLIIRATTPSLRKFAVSGSADVVLENISGERFVLDTSGSSEVKARGSVRSLEIDVSGSSEISAAELIAEGVKVDASGSCEVIVHAKESLEVDSSGSCDVRYRGRPALKVDVSGSGTVEPLAEEP